MSTASDRPSPPAGGRPILSPLRAVAAVCVIAPFVAMLWIPSYNKTNPKLLGFPFFYWYQLLWVPAISVLSWLIYLLLRTRPAPGADTPASAGDDRNGQI